jgi:hypothetical protein
MDTEKRMAFTHMMSCTDTLHLATGRGTFEKIDIKDLTRIMCNNFDGFSSKWDKFVLPSNSNPRSRCHKALEQADLRGDNIYFGHLLQGKTKLDDRVDADQIDFLDYYVRHAQVCWKFVCSASGCVSIATKTCGRCHVARYCSRECQISDWKISHKHSCGDFIAWNSSANIIDSESVMI